MKSVLYCTIAALLGVLSITPSHAQSSAGQAADATAPAIDPVAIRQIKAMTDNLRKLTSFEVKADTLNDMVMADNQTLQFAGSVTYKAMVPGKLFVDSRTDRKQRQYYYDGKQFTVYAPRMGYYGSIPASGSLADLVDTAQGKFGIDLPLSDLFTWGTEAGQLDDITSATYVGPAKIGEDWTSQYAVREGNVDWQVWITEGDNPLPRKLVMTANDDPARPSYIATLTWKTNPTLAASTFTFTPPDGATEIKVLPASVSTLTAEETAQ